MLSDIIPSKYPVEHRSLIKTLGKPRTLTREIESRITGLLPSTIEAIVVELSSFENELEQLTAFFCSSEKSPEIVQHGLIDLKHNLIETLPEHIIPKIFVPMESFPVLKSGEVDRHTLRKLTLRLPKDHLIQIWSLDGQPLEEDSQLTPCERDIRRLWAHVLNIPASRIHKRSTFISLGGDSIAAMKLVAVAREMGYNLLVSQIFQTPRLADLAACFAKPREGSQHIATLKPFSMLVHGTDLERLAMDCGLKTPQIEDAYPCTPVQESMLATSAHRPESFITHGTISLPRDVDRARLKASWEFVVSSNPILRTRIVQSSDGAFVQLVVNAPTSWTECYSPKELVHSVLGFGDPLIKFTFIHPDNSAARPKLRITIHHAIYDKWSLDIVLRAAQYSYLGRVDQPRTTPYNVFVRHLTNGSTETSATQFWTRYLSNMEAPQFPELPASDYIPLVSSVRKRSLEHLDWHAHFTQATMLKAAWSIIILQYTNSDDTVFGSTVMGRQTDLLGIESVVGPTIATVPIRICVNRQKSRRGLLGTIQTQAAEMTPHEHIGMAKLQRLSDHTRRGCRFQSLLVIQPPHDHSDEVFDVDHEDVNLQRVSTYAITLECVLSKSPGRLMLNMSFDEKVIKTAQADRMLAQFDCTLRALCKEESDSEPVSRLSALTDEDAFQIWTWNRLVPVTIPGRFNDLIAERVEDQPHAIAVCAWDGDLTYRDLYGQARKVAFRLVTEYGIGPEAIVPICLHKSKWVPVALLAVIIAGGVVVMLDPSQPVSRLQSICEQVNGRIVLTSKSATRVVKDLGQTLIIDEEFLNPLAIPESTSWIPLVVPENALYITFTSGTTGQPKGSIMTHSNCCSAITHQKRRFGYTDTSRVLQHASCSFDVVWQQYMQVFTCGACLCIPSEHDCHNNISEAIEKFRVNHLDITPSLARVLDPEQCPTLQKITFGGEALALDDVSRWGDRVEVRNSYGPSECTVCSTIAKSKSDFSSQINMGTAYGLNTWIVDALNPEELAPIGAVGELWLEGPLVGRGYLNDPTKTCASFPCDPPWLRRGHPSLTGGRRGRLFKTGDMVRYNERGQIRFIGRRDAQVKIRGQRVELEEIEVHARRILGEDYIPAVEVIQNDTNLQHAQILTMFICPSNSLLEELPPDLIKRLNRDLLKKLPRYLVPASYSLLKRIPLTLSGKIDRKALRGLGSQIRSEKIESKSIRQGHMSEYEVLMSQLWSSILNIPSEKMDPEDDFFDLGGDSVDAIRLTGMGRKHGFVLSVSHIFQERQLHKLAKARSKHTIGSSQAPDPLTDCLDHNLPTVSEVVGELQIPEEIIVGIYPTTEFQQYAIKCALEKPCTEWNYFSANFGQNADIARLVNVCTRLVDRIEILRSAFLCWDDTYVLVALRRAHVDVNTIEISDSAAGDLTMICRKDLESNIGPRTSFVKFWVVHHLDTGEIRLIFRISHAQYDGISMPLIGATVAALYDQKPLPKLAPMSGYLSRVSHRRSNAYEYWTNLLNQSPLPSTLSRRAQRTIRPGRRLCRVKTIELWQAVKGVTTATLFAAAWAFALSSVDGAAEVVFTRAVTGRSSGTATDHDDHVIGPCLNLVPVRVQSPRSQDHHGILRMLQSQFIESLPNETVGFKDIVDRCTEWPTGTGHGSVFYFQNIDEARISLNDLDICLEPIQFDRPEPPEPPRLNVLPQDGHGFTLELSFYDESCSDVEAQMALDRMSDWLGRL